MKQSYYTNGNKKCKCSPNRQTSSGQQKNMVTINSYNEYKAYEGQMIGVSGWHTIDQDQIDKFAEATLDYQWIHVDKEKAENEGPFKSTIAHGYLTLSLIPYLWKQIADVRNVTMEINYGIENFRFGQAVPVNSDVQLQATVKSVTNLKGTVKVLVEAKLLIRDQRKPAYTGDVIFLYHFS
ncbi:MaoC family dehydratase [Chryseobacterium rhizosphaerae]|uniref:MaoC family dehydratase n=1 Tax=Chryseobacterium rhizosphaerae TaxID=395937 RepID=UPI002359AD80|nr:MaoC family dehydratase [Chryseobacterium rhizosphaerae]MDC8099435.1 MaoC family dehydratase [Chryseobacterium rhizosphaerae]